MLRMCGVLHKLVVSSEGIDGLQQGFLGILGRGIFYNDGQGQRQRQSHGFSECLWNTLSAGAR